MLLIKLFTTLVVVGLCLVCRADEHTVNKQSIKARPSTVPFQPLNPRKQETVSGYLLPSTFGNGTISSLKSAPPCGTVLSSFNGIESYSNGENQGTGYSCGDWTPTGYAYQCVEYTQRYFNYLYGIQAVWPVNYASQMCDAYPAGIQPVGYPSVGFGVVFNWGTYGHTAVVIGVGDGTIDVIEENGSSSGTNTYGQGEVLCYLALA
jgi:hypothetical protein